MKLSIQRCLLLTTAMLLGLTGCSAGAASLSSRAPETPEEFHAAMLERSLVSVGNSTRIHAAMDKAKSGADVKLAYIGGSITEGYNAGDNVCYARKSYEAFSAAYGTGSNVQYINAGLSGTPSVLGILRAQEDVLQYAPDVVFLEFAVNDAQDEAHRVAYESLVQTCLTQPQAPAVVLLFTILDTGYTCQPQMSAIGAHYDLPMISVGDAITPELDAGRMAWKDYASDGAHPHKDGHAMIAELISHYFAAAAQTAAAPEELPEAPLNSWADVGASLVPWEKLTVTDYGSFPAGQTSYQRFSNGCVFAADGSTKPLCFTVMAKRLYLTFKQCNSADWGMMGVYVNGQLADFLAGNEKNGWGGPSTKLVYEGTETAELSVEIRPLDEQERLRFELLAVSVNAD